MKNYIIGVAGKAGAGKDIVAEMINYIFAVGVTKANYVDFQMKRKTVNYKNGDRIIHFADNVKEVLSVMFSINKQFFYDRKYKDEMWYCFSTGEFVDSVEINKHRKDFYLITNNMLNAFDLRYIIDHAHEDFICIKLRTLMQYFATDICRRYISDDIWVKSTIRKAVDIANAKRVCIIPDVRFKNEANVVRYNNEYLYGGVIMVNREVEQMKHSSETDDIEGDYTIDNNGTFTALFYKVLNIIQEIIK